MRIPLIVGNWKMNKTASEAVILVRELLARASSFSDTEIVLAPPFTALDAVRSVLGPASPLGLAGQNLHWESHGPFTGEVSAPMLRDLGCRYVIVGHSERRTLFGESDETIKKKVHAALAHGLRPILCVGESLAERETGQTDAVVLRQLSAGIDQVTPQDMAMVTIAYEPVWAIGTGRAASTEQAAAVHRSIRALLTGTLAEKTASAVRILYGGSVTPHNAASLLEVDDIDGALVGGACLNAESFATIAAAAGKKAAC